MLTKSFEKSEKNLSASALVINNAQAILLQDSGYLKIVSVTDGR